jgi:hypothetical protein
MGTMKMKTQYLKKEVQNSKRQKKDTESLESEIRGDIEQAFFKVSTPAMATPNHSVDWFITLSKYSFPWIEVAFDGFSAKECYEVYRE